MRRIAEATIDPRLIEGRNVVLFEDGVSETNLYPLSVLRPVSEIRCGMGCLRDWIVELVGSANIEYAYRACFDAKYAQKRGQISHTWENSNETIFVNARILGIWGTESTPKLNYKQTVIDSSGAPLLALRDITQTQDLLKLPGTELAAYLVQGVEGVEDKEVGVSIEYASYIWDYMIKNPKMLKRQLSASSDQKRLGGACALREGVIGVDIIGENPVFAGENVKLWPQTVISTEDGPVWIGEGTEIEPHCFLKGPLYIGDHNRVKAGTRLYSGSSFGPQCRIAGEISQSVFQGFVNKQHEGFIGNSVLGQWINLGAETTCSNLRNDYGEITMKVGGGPVKSGERFIGLIAGDHTKTGIHTMFNTGTIVGIAANVYGYNYPPRRISSFAWGGYQGFRYPPFERTLKSARIAASRRGQEISDFEASLMQDLYSKMINQETSD